MTKTKNAGWLRTRAWLVRNKFRVIAVVTTLLGAFGASEFAQDTTGTVLEGLLPEQAVTGPAPDTVVTGKGDTLLIFPDGKVQK